MSRITKESAVTQKPTIYLLPGMAAEYPVFSRLAPMLPNAMLVNYIEPEHNESLASYASRLASRFQSISYIVGVSFGGMLAVEISRIVRPKGCVLISSVFGPDQFPPWLRAGGFLGGKNCLRILNFAGGTAALVPSSIRTASTYRISKFSETNNSWQRWATSAVLDWKPNSEPINWPLLHIHGDADSTFPIRYVNPDIVVRGGRHALPVSHPTDVADAITKFTNTA